MMDDSQQATQQHMTDHLPTNNMIGQHPSNTVESQQMAAFQQPMIESQKQLTITTESQQLAMVCSRNICETGTCCN